MSDIPDIVFIGSPTLDTVVRRGRAKEATAGAAFISALAARWIGATAGIVARVPRRLPEEAAMVFGDGGLHRGGLTPTEGQLPGFRIEYDDEDRATYSLVDVGMEKDLCADDIPESWLTAHTDWIHIAGVGLSASQQLRILYGIRQRAPEWEGILSAGTCRAMIEEDRESTLALLMASQFFFLNEEEFDLLCPAGLPEDFEGTILVTRGPQGVEVLGREFVGRYPTEDIQIIDPTGAGDAFCGGFIGGFFADPEAPVQRGIDAAALVLSDFGAAALSKSIAMKVGARAAPFTAHIKTISESIQADIQSSTFDFTAKPHLPVGHPHALEMLCISTMHQFGFWYGDTAQGWIEPMYAELDGVRYKGSDFIWAAFARAAKTDPTLLSLDRMTNEKDLLLEICKADDGQCPLPEPELYRKIHQTHGWVMRSKWPGGYAELVAHANQSDTPVATLVENLSNLPGYMSDPLRKKANLLAIILANRPEHFLQATDIHHVEPIVDYHMMRVSLRTGCVQILDPDLERRNKSRLWIDAPEEYEIRHATSQAIASLVKQTSSTVAAIDGLFFKVGRTWCLETEDPKCEECPLTEACQRNKRLFQPVFRTTDY
ncbi:MAG: carbohydrate kinase family protein [Myxococcota bacterium]